MGPHYTSMLQLAIQITDLSILLSCLTCRLLKSYVQLLAELQNSERQVNSDALCITPSTFNKGRTTVYPWLWCNAYELNDLCSPRSDEQNLDAIPQHRQCILYRMDAGHCCDVSKSKTASSLLAIC